MPFETWLLYLVTCCGIAVVPGPNALLVLTHGAIHGNRKTLFTISGGVSGFVVMLSLCALGLGALIQASVTWFMVLKVVGGLYLIWLGLGLWRSAPVSLDVDAVTGSGRGRFSARACCRQSRTPRHCCCSPRLSRPSWTHTATCSPRLPPSP